MATLEAVGIADGPDALCLANGYVVFVPHVLPGERVRVEVTSAGRKHGRGEPVQVLQASPHRVAPRCAHFGACGGCHFQHADIGEQLRIKRERLGRMLAHTLKTPVESLPIRPLAAPTESWGQRTKIALVLHPTASGRIDAGLYARRSNDVVPLTECPVSDPAGFALARAVVAEIERLHVPIADPTLSGRYGGGGGLRAVVVRALNGSDGRHVILVGTPAQAPFGDRLIDALAHLGAAGVAYNVNHEAGPQLLGRETHVMYGPNRLLEVVDGRQYLVSPGAFFQTSAWGVNHLVRTVRELVVPHPEHDLLDLYCGGGLLTLALADRCRRAVGIEGNPHAIDDARASARLAGIENVDFVAGRVEQRLHEAARRLTVRTAVLDPPRDGCAPAILHTLTEHILPRRIIYVSCEPTTLARDAAVLMAAGYRPTDFLPFDMFPHTAHLETVAVFDRHASAPRT